MSSGFDWGPMMDLNMGYMAVPLDKNEKNVLTVITPWGLYENLE